MAIRTEQLEGNLTRTWSDIGMRIERDGIRYDEAIDPTDKGRTYIETDEPVAHGDVNHGQQQKLMKRYGIIEGKEVENV